MEWTLSVNEVLKAEITKLDSSFMPPGFHGDVHRIRAVQDSLGKMVNTIGAASTAAQGLHRIITTAERLRSAPQHHLYLLKDAKANGGQGQVIGLLKVGRKHLFLYDDRDRTVEVEPLCVLDFYVETSRQRHGYGRKLFDYMLKDMQTTVEQLAIDGPSTKMEEFLRKNYGVNRLIRQSNNFAVVPSFFNSGPTPDRYRNKDRRLSETGLNENRSTPVLPFSALGRFAASRPPSLIANVIHGGGAAGGYHLESPDDGAESPDVWHSEKIQDPTLLPGQESVPVPEKEPWLEVFMEPEPPILAFRPDSLSVSVERASSVATVPGAGASSTPARRDSQLTDRGYFDVKFYHNKLW